MNGLQGSIPIPLLEGVTHRWVQARGISFQLAEAGAESGSDIPVVLLHGWPQNWFCWRKVIPLLAARRRVICPDLRGFGWSDAPRGAYDKQTLADDVIAILDALGLERVDLLAHDWGAWVGFLLGLDHPERIAHYLALNIYPPWPDPPTPSAALGLARLWYQAALATPGLGQRLIRHPDFVRRLIMAVELREDSGHFIAEELPELVAERAHALFDGERPSVSAASG